MRHPSSQLSHGTRPRTTPHPQLNCITHLLSMVPYEPLPSEPITLPPRQKDDGYVRPPQGEQTFVPQVGGVR